MNVQQPSPMFNRQSGGLVESAVVTNGQGVARPPFLGRQAAQNPANQTAMANARMQQDREAALRAYRQQLANSQYRQPGIIGKMMSI